jgi:spore germination protein YaaH
MPAAFLLAVTLAVIGIRMFAFGHHAPSRPHAPKVHHVSGPRFYIVRAGDTLSAVAAKTGVSAARLRQLNPKLQPTALFIGERIHLR